MSRVLLLCVVCLSFASIARADDRVLRLLVPEPLMETGLMKHLLPRFSLKTQVRVVIEPDEAQANIVLGDTGREILVGPDRVWAMQVLTPDHAATVRFTDWLLSDVGQRTITSFAPDGVPMFTLPDSGTVAEIAVEFDGDARQGQALSRQMCGRCHAIRPEDSKNAIGSTPSFRVLRSLDGWENRFRAFYVLNPHPAFTQVADVTAPFPPDRPPPIVPLNLTIEQIEAILAFAASLTPADLGAALLHQ